MLELKKFLFVVGMSMKEEEKDEARMVPSPLIDRLWRLLISSYMGYRKFCQELFVKEAYRSSRQVLNYRNYRET